MEGMRLCPSVVSFVLFGVRRTFGNAITTLKECSLLCCPNEGQTEKTWPCIRSLPFLKSVLTGSLKLKKKNCRNYCLRKHSTVFSQQQRVRGLRMTPCPANSSVCGGLSSERPPAHLCCCGPSALRELFGSLCFPHSCKYIWVTQQRHTLNSEELDSNHNQEVLSIRPCPWLLYTDGLMSPSKTRLLLFYNSFLKSWQILLCLPQ